MRSTHSAPAGDPSFVGTQAGCLELPGFSVAHWFSRPSDCALRPHGHAHAHLMFYTGGQYLTEAHGDVASATQPLIFNPRQTYHCDRPVTGGGSFFTVTLHDDHRPELVELALPAAPVVVVRPSSRRLIHQLIKRYADRPLSSSIDIEFVCLELAASIDNHCVQESRRPPWLARSVELLVESPDEPQTIAEVADFARVHPAHFARTFRRFYGCTPGDFRRSTRLHSAATRLSRTRLPITEIALDAGFADQSHFTKAFKRWFGVSPAIYRGLTT